MHQSHRIEELTRRNVAVIAQMERASQEVRTRGERLADVIAGVVGSWTFILVQSVLLGLWVTLNVFAWIKHWDPYPFILLNLALSFQSAYAAPILMISQNRQAKLGERRNHLDLQINMLAEQESTEILRLLRLLCERSGVAVKGADEAAFEEETRHDRIVEQIESVIEKPLIEAAAAKVDEKVDRKLDEKVERKVAEKVADEVARKVDEEVDARIAEARPKG